MKLIDLGTHSNEYQGQVSVRRQCIIGWELCDEFLTTGEYAGQPFTLSRFFTMSLSEKANLRKILTAWRGRDFTPEELEGFDLKTILGVPCFLNVTHNDKGRAQVNAVMAMPRKSSAPKQFNVSVYLSLDPAEYDPAVFDAMSDKMKALIQDSPEWLALQSEPAEEDTDYSQEPDGSEGDESDIVF
jgi:hypothetical protein